MRKRPDVSLTLHIPEDPAALAELRRRLSRAHGEAVVRSVRDLSISREQKLRLIDRVIQTVTSG